MNPSRFGFEAGSFFCRLGTICAVSASGLFRPSIRGCRCRRRGLSRLGREATSGPTETKTCPRQTMNPIRFGFEASLFFSCCQFALFRRRGCSGVVAVSAQARLQVSASAVWFGIVDTALDSAGASRKKTTEHQTTTRTSTTTDGVASPNLT